MLLYAAFKFKRNVYCIGYPVGITTSGGSCCIQVKKETNPGTTMIRGLVFWFSKKIKTEEDRAPHPSLTYSNRSVLWNMWPTGKFARFGSTSSIHSGSTPNQSAMGLHTASQEVEGMNRPPLLKMFKSLVSSRRLGYSPRI